MNHPPYHLRPNKAIDRFLLLELIAELEPILKTQNYSYYGFGGPFLEDCRVIHNSFKEMPIYSIEEDEETYKRQQFNKFSKKINLKRQSSSRFLTEFVSTGQEIIWLDYTCIKPSVFEDFTALLDKCDYGSIVKITIRAHRDHNPYQMTPKLRGKQFDEAMKRFERKFRGQFNRILPMGFNVDMFRAEEFPGLIQAMLQRSAERALPARSKVIFQPLHSVYYKDGNMMLSTTGLICNLSDVDKIKKRLKGWLHANLDWSPPEKLDIPILTLKERLFLEDLLPQATESTKLLAKRIGFMVGSNVQENEAKLTQYLRFYRYYPYFVKLTP